MLGVPGHQEDVWFIPVSTVHLSACLARCWGPRVREGLSAVCHRIRESGLEGLGLYSQQLLSHWSSAVGSWERAFDSGQPKDEKQLDRECWEECTTRKNSMHIPQK